MASTIGPRASTLLAVGAHPVWPITNGYSLRASGLIRELALRRRVVYAGPLGDVTMSDLGNALGVARVVPVEQFRGWDSQLTDDDRATIRATLDRIFDEERPAAAVLMPGTEVMFEHPRFPPRILDRMDSEVVMAWRDVKAGLGVKNKVRALRNLALWTRHERALVRSASAVTVDANVDAQIMQRVSGRSAVHVLPSGVAVQPIASADEEATEPTVVFTGSMSYSANVDAVCWFVERVWPLVRTRVPAARLVIAGRGPTSNVTSLGSVAGVEIRGDVPDMWPVLRSSWLAVCPVQSGSGIRTKVLEAWAVGRPVVMSAVGATGLPRDPDVNSLIANGARATANRVADLLGNHTERHRLGTAMHALAKRAHDGWSRSGDRLCQLLDEVARG
jgi:glycosyltransferase involved in cell wall biosynthesis